LGPRSNSIVVAIDENEAPASALRRSDGSARCESRPRALRGQDEDRPVDSTAPAGAAGMRSSRHAKEVQVCVQCGLYVLVELRMAQIDARPHDSSPLGLVYYCLETIMNVSIDTSRRSTPRWAASCGREQISSAGRMPLDIRPYLHPATHGWREPMIRRAAYLRSLNRGFQPGKGLED
jgi:hypothetical protein